MKTENWRQVKDIFEQAINLAPEERRRFLDEISFGGTDVRREVEELLSSFDNAGNFLETPAVSRAEIKPAKGDALGRYEIIERIGAGGMGEVFLALDATLRRKVALKILPAEFTGDRERLRRFEREAFAASSLNHPNILTIYEIGEADGVNFIASEFVEGETLRELVKRENPSLQDVLDVAAQVAAALAAAHKNGIVHRDIKPENVMIRRDDRLVKVLDFGLAKMSETAVASAGENAGTQTQTQAGMILGTIRYMSPEQARGLAVDARSDLWSFGVVLYEMIAGRLPFDGETTSDAIAAILKTDAAPLPDAVPEELRRIVAKLLRRQPDERYQTAADLLADLKALKQDLDFSAKLQRPALSGKQKTAERGYETNIQPAQNPTAARAGRDKFSLILIALVLLGGAAFLGVYFLQNKLAANSAQKEGAATTKIDSLAVLPFENASPETDYLADGITESLINSLSNLPNLRVVSRGTVFGFKGKTAAPEEIGKTLNVRAVLTGKISQQNDAVVIQADLVDVASNSQIWGEHYNAKMSDLLRVQEEIARQITDKLQLKLNNRQKAQIAKHYTENTEAYREYLKGRYYTLQYTPEGHQKALEHLNRAIAIDPTFALAYAGVADAYTTVSDWMLPPREALSKAKAAAQKALDLDDSLAEAYAARGHARLHEWDRAAIEDLNRAIALAPSVMTNYLWLGEYYMIFDPPQAIPVLQKAAEIDPLSELPPGFLLFVYSMLRQPETAIKYGQKARELAPDNHGNDYYYVLPHLLRRDYQTALDILNRIPPEQTTADAVGVKACIFAFEGRRAEAERILAELQKQSRQSYVSPLIIAGIYAALGDRDKTFFWLEKAYEDRSEGLGFIRNDFRFDSVRDDPRYKDLIRRIGFSE